mmetsp:Transcript_27129/g.55272  ORF Transcript_27129/g.55272 Transcript_27129/m.55272 type:complete len:571 (-) Transcript_27129:175-1887(-)|eukprot:CAMPEP_0181297358 /NCGR_PEP_ID=MMETSP1101-20121128/5197_1 /TAXON_ID=46948 /ORGANISM="Rhodomonas abbreviata, Strain Caron Lab Isolate" /LENGTH=570 /DNA_ID=CAMNT_0023402289 /DNA_START=364 /DNA_END=2076 /DNA_ORIENTATION=-
MEIVLVYQKLRKDFGRAPKFNDMPADVLSELMPNPDGLAEYVERNPTDVAIQCIPEYSEHEVNTERFELQSQGIIHLEGGWPKDVDPSEVEQTLRFIKKTEKDEDYIRTIKGLGESLEHMIRQNNAIDIYEEYFIGDAVDHSGEPPSAKTLTVFRDPNPVKRTATCISWYPDGAKKVAVSYAILQFQRQPEGMSRSSYVWDVTNPNYPELELMPASPLCCIEYNPKETHIMIGGCYNGLLQTWDDRKGQAPTESSPIEKSHRDPVYDVAWLQSKTGTECATVSTDGQLFFWDIRKLGEPTEGMPLQVGADGATLGGVTLSYDSAAGPTNFLVGTEQGTVLLCKRKSKSPADRIGAVYPGHHGPIYALERHPVFVKNFLTVGDWTARIWMDDLKTPIMTTKYHASYLTDGCWSPTRPGVFFTTKMDGTLDIWDYFFKQNDPTFTLQVTDIPLHTLRVETQGRLIATGAADGSTTLFEICAGLSAIQPNEKPSIMQMLEREAKREKNLETRAKELRLAAKKAEAQQAKEKKGDEVEKEEQRLKEVERDFFEMISSGDDSAAPAPTSAKPADK